MFRYLKDELHAVHEDREGQAIIFTTIVLFTMFLFVAFAFNVGHFVGERISAQTSADAAALSGAAWQARGLNVITTLNYVQNNFTAHLELEMAHATLWTAILAEAAVIAAASLGTVTAPLEAVRDPAQQEIEDAANELEYYTATNFTGKGVNNVQEFIAQVVVPITVNIETAYVGGELGLGLNRADITVPVAFGEPFFDDSTPGLSAFSFGAVPLEIESIYNIEPTRAALNPFLEPDFGQYLGDVFDELLSELGNLTDDEIEDGGLGFVEDLEIPLTLIPPDSQPEVAVLNENFYPDYFFTFAATFTEFESDGGAIFENTFRNESVIQNGFLTVAQARPYVPDYIQFQTGADPRNLRATFDDLTAFQTDWDTQLMPVTVDNYIAGVIPYLGSGLAATIGDSLLLH